MLNRSEVIMLTNIQRDCVKNNNNKLIVDGRLCQRDDKVLAAILPVLTGLTVQV